MPTLFELWKTFLLWNGKMLTITLIVALVIAVGYGFLVEKASWQVGCNAAFRVHVVQELPFNVPLVIEDRFEKEGNIFFVKLADPPKGSRAYYLVKIIAEGMEIGQTFQVVWSQGKHKIEFNPELRVVSVRA